jgi:hypothetical protein
LGEVRVWYMRKIDGREGLTNKRETEEKKV